MVARAMAEDRAAKWPASAFQRYWATPTLFLLCPEVAGADGLAEYCWRLQPGMPFSSNCYGNQAVVRARLTLNGDVLSVVSANPTPIHAAGHCLVYLEDGRFCHEANAVFRSLVGGLKAQSELVGSADVFPPCIDDDIG